MRQTLTIRSTVKDHSSHTEWDYGAGTYRDVFRLDNIDNHPSITNVPYTLGAVVQRSEIDIDFVDTDGRSFFVQLQQNITFYKAVVKTLQILQARTVTSDDHTDQYIREGGVPSDYGSYPAALSSYFSVSSVRRRPRQMEHSMSDQGLASHSRFDSTRKHYGYV